MKNMRWIIAAIAALLAAGCANFPGGDHAKSGRSFVPLGTEPRVDLQYGFIVVSPEPLVIDPTTRGKESVITWRLPADSKYRFPAQTGSYERTEKPGIQFDKTAADEVICRGPSEDRLSFTCLTKYTKKGKYSYVIRLVGPDGKLTEIDPSMVAP